MAVLATISFGGCGNTVANGHNEAFATSVCKDLRVWGNDINQAGLHAEPAIAGQPPTVERQLQASLAGQAADITTTLSDQLTELAGHESAGSPSNRLAVALSEQFQTVAGRMRSIQHQYLQLPVNSAKAYNADTVPLVNEFSSLTNDLSALSLRDISARSGAALTNAMTSASACQGMFH